MQEAVPDLFLPDPGAGGGRFRSIVASTFQATYVDGVLDTAASATNASVAMISLLFIVMAVLFGFFVYRRGASLAVATIAGCVAS